MRKSFLTRLESVLDDSPPRLRRKIRQNIAILLDAGIDSLEAAWAYILDEDANVKTQSVACWALGQIRDKRSVRILLKALESKGKEICWEAAKSIGLIGSRHVVRPLIAILLKDEDLNRRMAAAYTLGQLQDTRAVVPLLRILLNRKEKPALRGHVAEALAYIGDKRAVQSLIGTLKDPAVEVRFWSAFALGVLKDQRAIPQLKMAGKDNSILPGWGAVGKEATEAIKLIRKA